MRRSITTLREGYVQFKGEQTLFRLALVVGRSLPLDEDQQLKLKIHAFKNKIADRMISATKTRRICC